MQSTPSNYAPSGMPLHSYQGAHSSGYHQAYNAPIPSAPPPPNGMVDLPPSYAAIPTTAPNYGLKPPQSAVHGTASGAPASMMGAPDDRLDRLAAIAMKYELAGGAIAKLRQLEGYDIVVIADDSSSMKAAAHEASPSNPFEAIPSRWQELQKRVGQIAEIATCLDRDGIDVYFLNGGCYRNITTPEETQRIFNRQPNGYTPLTDVYNQVLQENLADLERKLLVVIATDGEPNTVVRGQRYAQRDTDRFESLLIRRGGFKAARCPTTIMACTDNPSEMGWLNAVDVKADKVDIVDDYRAERAEVHAAQGRDFPFNEGDYVVKTLLGSLDPIYDKLDETKLKSSERREYLGITKPKRKSKPCTIL